MIDCLEIIARYYEPGTPLYHTLVTHSQQVTALAQAICNHLLACGVPVDSEFVGEAAMLHDVGIIHTDAPSIHCHGTEPYVRHGILGRQMLEAIGLYRHALVCERHTGAGISLDDILSQQLPLPHRDMLPISIEEKVVCYADKFFSKTHLEEPPRTLERVRKSLAKFGTATVERFEALHSLLAIPETTKIDPNE